MAHFDHSIVLRFSKLTPQITALLVTPLLGHCLDSGNIRNGIRILNGTREGDVVTFRCLEGHGLLGFRQLVCGPDGEWNGLWPRCFRGTVRMYFYGGTSLLRTLSSMGRLQRAASLTMTSTILQQQDFDGDQFKIFFFACCRARPVWGPGTATPPRLPDGAGDAAG